MIKIITAMIKTKFGFFERVIKHMFANPLRLAQPQFGVSPKGLDAVNMRVRIGKFIAAMFNPEMLRIADLNQAMIASPTIG